MNKKTLVKCGVAGLLCLVALGGAVMSFGLQQTRAATPPSLSSAPASSSDAAQGDVVSSKMPIISYNVRSHWTAKRMKAAHPAEELLTQKVLSDHPVTPLRPPSIGKPQMVDPVAPTSTQRNTQGPADEKTLSSQATAVKPPYTYPYSTVGKVFFTYGKTDYVCSGTAVVSANENTIDTAGHCVVAGGKNKFYTNWMFCSNYSPKNTCNQDSMWVATMLFSHANWAKKGWLTYDYGAAVVTTNSSTNSATAAASLTESIGGAGIAYNQSAQQSYTALGYPQAAPFDGSTLEMCQSALSSRDQPVKAGPSTSAITCNMTGGSSGGGWLISRNGKSYLNGHNDYKYTNDPNHMYSPYYGDDWFKVYDAAQNYGA